VFAIDIIIGNYSAAYIYSGGEQPNTSDICLVMSATSTDPPVQGLFEADVSATPTPPAMAELSDPSTYKVYRPPNTLDSTSSKRQSRFPVTDAALLTDL